MMQNKINFILSDNYTDLLCFSDIIKESTIITDNNIYQSNQYNIFTNNKNIIITPEYENYKNQQNLIFLSNINNAIYYVSLWSDNIWIIGNKQLFDLIDNKVNIIYTKNNIFAENLYEIYKSDNFYKYTKINTFSKEQSDKLSTSESQYLNLLRSTIIGGEFRQTRNDFTWSDFGSQLEFNMCDGFPLLTSKKMPLRIIFEELMFFIRGYTDNQILNDKNIHIWDANTSEDFIKSYSKTYENSDKLLQPNDMGPMYGFQWRYFGSKYDKISNSSNTKYYDSDKKYDQLQKVLDELTVDPFSRRIIMTTFNPAQVEYGVLYPCHSIVIQFYAKSNPSDSNNLLLSIKMYQRSADLFLGLPFNIASTALLLYLVCDYLSNKSNKSNSTTYTPHKLILTLGDTHVYQSHLDAVLTQLQSRVYDFPQLNIIHKNKFPTRIDDYEWENIQLINYKADKLIKAKMIA